jgi:hypothetical protein
MSIATTDISTGFGATSDGTIVPPVAATSRESRRFEDRVGM